MPLVYAKEAVEDLIRLRTFIAKRDPQAAELVSAELLRRMDDLLEFPRTGKKVALSPDPENIRDKIFGNYVVRYAIHDPVIAILRVWHHLEDWKK